MIKKNVKRTWASAILSARSMIIGAERKSWQTEKLASW